MMPAPSSTTTSSLPATDTQPWWKYGHVWLLISGPAIVVVAGFVTLWLAMRQPDPILAEDYYQRGLNINATLKQQDASMTPAVKGRNHAVTPLQDQPTR